MFVSDSSFEDFNQILEASLPEDVETSLINRSVLGDVETRNAILSGVNGGPMVVTYTGHGSTGVWTNGGVFKYSDAPILSNSSLSFYMLMTCLNGYSHNAYNESMAETLVKAPNGAIAVWASSASTFAEEQFPMSQEASRLIFNQPNQLRLGDIVRQAKQQAWGQDVRRSWQLLGDPTVFIK
jgi:hypothetical protein